MKQQNTIIIVDWKNSKFIQAYLLCDFTLIYSFSRIFINVNNFPWDWKRSYSKNSYVREK